MDKLIVIVLLIGLTFTSIWAANQEDNAAQAKKFLELLNSRAFQTAESYVSEDIKGKLGAATLEGIWKQVNDQAGAFKAQSFLSRQKVDTKEIILIKGEFSKVNLKITLSFNDKGKIDGFFLGLLEEKAAAYAPPAYADQTKFEEREVTIGAGEWALPGTLTLPKGGSAKFPAVVLVHGSGPNDRDETHANRSNKIFKDLAWGLASRGIAVLRYDKRSFVHGAKMVALKNSFTLNEETIDDAVLAVELLRRTPEIDAKNIFVLGHSLGGMAIPRIAKKDAQIAGLIVFAGTARPLEDVVVEQYNYLAALDGSPSGEVQAKLDEEKKLAEITKNLKADSPPTTPTTLGLPVSYWVDLNGYNPPVVAKTLKQPMLILQGESDYQVTMKDFANWKAALDQKRTVTFKTYPNLTHAFMESLGGKPGPQDYQKTNHVNETVVGDIAAWILRTALLNKKSG